MTIAKSINKTLDISVEDVRIDLTATIRSYDLTDTQFIFEIKSSNGMTIDLTGSTTMYIVEYVHNSQTYAIEGEVNIIGTDTLSFNLPEDLKGYSGAVLIGIYVELTDGTKIDIKDIAVRIEPSIMDKDIDFTAKTYFKDFEKVKAEVILEGEKAKTEINQVLLSVKAEISEINQVLPSVKAEISEIKNRLVALEQKEDGDTVYDDSKLVERIENLESDDKTIKERISALEDKPDNDTIYDDSNLKAQIAELESKLQSLNTVRRAPTGYTLDRTTTPWTVWFDNGCGLRFPKNSPTSERDKANLIYGYGFPANNNSTVAFSAPIPPLIISASRGAFTVDKFKESDEAHFHVTYVDYRLYYPIRKSDDFNWENAYGDRVNQTVSTNGKSNFAKLMYELGIWSEEDVLYLGATKK